ncbi:MAG: biopolymer transporter ExbD [Verrucomicrobia bacterium]|nr:biopolymer transporter ExbD [Verrucomicrobiota bacterium]
MKFATSIKIFRGQFDAAPFAGVLFVLVMLFMVHSALVFTPGVKINLPAEAGLSGASGPTVAVAIDPAGQLYFENQLIREPELRTRLAAAVKATATGLTLVIQADEGVDYQSIVRLGKLARETGFREALLATRPKAFAPPPAAKPTR